MKYMKSEKVWLVYGV